MDVLTAIQDKYIPLKLSTITVLGMSRWFHERCSEVWVALARQVPWYGAGCPRRKSVKFTK